MKTIYLLLTAVLLLGLLSCSGDDPIDQDTVAPSAPKLIHHLGDAGDDPVIIDNQQVYWNDDNNGMDTVPDGNWIKIPWEPFIDNDLSHVKIFRFSEANPEPILLNTVPAVDDYYLDQSPLVEREWYSYYIELYDASGNFSVSDTSSYSILAKSLPTYPADGSTVSLNNLTLKWNIGDSNTTRFRVLVWNNSNELIYSTLYFYAPTQENPPPPQVPFPILTPAPPSGEVLRWRVDAFDWDSEHGQDMGSESEERTFTVQ